MRRGRLLGVIRGGCSFRLVPWAEILMSNGGCLDLDELRQKRYENVRLYALIKYLQLSMSSTFG